MRPDGVQRLVSILQELEKDGTTNDSVCCKVIVPRGMSNLMVYGLVDKLVPFKLMAMNVVPRLILDDA